MEFQNMEVQFERAKPIRVAVVEDSPEFLSEIVQSIAQVPKLMLAGTAGSSAGAIALLANAKPDLLILDLFLEQGTGIDVLKYLQSKQHVQSVHQVTTGQTVTEQSALQTTVVVMTSCPSSQLEHHCLALGASQFHDKTEGFDWISEIAVRLGAKEKTKC